MLLAIDTSTSFASVALFDGRVLSETTWKAGREHSTHVMEEVDRTLARLGRKKTDLSAIAVAVGPGSFTGVRVGVALAKGLGFALELPVFAVGSLDVLAEEQEFAPHPVRPLLEAGRARFATALFERGPDGPRQVEDVRGIALTDLPALVQRPTVLCGDLWGPQRQQARELLGSLAVIASSAASLRRAGFLAQIAWRRWEAGQRPRAEAVEPVYLVTQGVSG